MKQSCNCLHPTCVNQPEAILIWILNPAMKILSGKTMMTPKTQAICYDLDPAFGDEWVDTFKTHTHTHKTTNICIRNPLQLDLEPGEEGIVANTQKK